MNKRWLRGARIILAILTVGVVCFAGINAWSNSLNYNPNAYPKNGLTNFFPDHIGYYRINPETILTSLDQGETDVFAPEPATPSAPILNTAISWHQSDYLKITNAVFQSAWKETFNSWSLLSMVFYTACHDDPNGFESGDIHFFQADGDSDYATREVLIAPQYGNVSWGGGGLGSGFPRPSSGWKSINLDRLRITADEALRIAEENGGKEFRQTTKNNCIVSMILNMDAYGSWHVDYQWNESIFSIEIDPYTGKATSSRTFLQTPKPSP